MPTAFQNMSRTIVNNNTVFNGGSPIINQYCGAPSNQTTATQPMQATGTQDHVSGGGANATGSDNGQEDDQPPSISVSAITFDNNGRIRLPHGFLQPLKRANDFDHAKKLMAYYPFFKGDKDLIQMVERGDKIVWSDDQVKKFQGKLQDLWTKIAKKGRETFEDGIRNEYSKWGFRKGKTGSWTVVKDADQCYAFMSNPAVRRYALEVLGAPFLIHKINNCCVHTQGIEGSQFYTEVLPDAIKEFGEKHTLAFTFDEKVDNPNDNRKENVRHSVLSVGASAIRDIKKNVHGLEEKNFGWSVRTQTGSQKEGYVKIEVDATLDEVGDGKKMTVLVKQSIAEQIVNFTKGPLTEESIRAHFCKGNEVQRKVAELSLVAVTNNVNERELIEMLKESIETTKKSGLFCRKTYGANDVTMRPIKAGIEHRQESKNQSFRPTRLNQGEGYHSPGGTSTLSDFNVSPLAFGKQHDQMFDFDEQLHQPQMQDQHSHYPIFDHTQMCQPYQHQPQQMRLQPHQQQTQRGGQPHQQQMQQMMLQLHHHQTQRGGPPHQQLMQQHYGGQLSRPPNPKQMQQDQAVSQQNTAMSAVTGANILMGMTANSSLQSQHAREVTNGGLSSFGQLPGGSLPVGAHQHTAAQSRREKNEEVLADFINDEIYTATSTGADNDRNSSVEKAPENNNDMELYEEKESKGGKDDEAEDKDEDEDEDEDLGANWIIEKITKVDLIPDKETGELVWQSLVKWKGYPNSENGWQTRDELAAFGAEHLRESTVHCLLSATPLVKKARAWLLQSHPHYCLFLFKPKRG